MPTFSAISSRVNPARYNCHARRRRSASALPLHRFWALSYSRLGSGANPPRLGRLYSLFAEKTETISTDWEFFLILLGTA